MKFTSFTPLTWPASPFSLARPPPPPRVLRCSSWAASMRAMRASSSSSASISASSRCSRRTARSSSPSPSPSPLLAPPPSSSRRRAAPRPLPLPRRWRRSPLRGAGGGGSSSSSSASAIPSSAPSSPTCSSFMGAGRRARPCWRVAHPRLRCLAGAPPPVPRRPPPRWSRLSPLAPLSSSPLSSSISSSSCACSCSSRARLAPDPRRAFLPLAGAAPAARCAGRVFGMSGSGAAVQVGGPGVRCMQRPRPGCPQRLRKGRHGLLRPCPAQALLRRPRSRTSVLFYKDLAQVLPQDVLVVVVLIPAHR
jgi:hypothetical protein